MLLLSIPTTLQYHPLFQLNVCYVIHSDHLWCHNSIFWNGFAFHLLLECKCKEEELPLFFIVVLFLFVYPGTCIFMICWINGSSVICADRMTCLGKIIEWDSSFNLWQFRNQDRWSYIKLKHTASFNIYRIYVLGVILMSVLMCKTVLLKIREFEGPCCLLKKFLKFGLSHRHGCNNTSGQTSSGPWRHGWVVTNHWISKHSHI